MPFFSGLVYKSNTHLFLFSASAYYRENGINNAAVIVCQRVVCMCVINTMCVLVIFERETLL